MQKLLFSLAIVTVVVSSLNAQYTYNSLRIVIGNDTNPVNLVMNTNQDTTVRVQGQRSNDSVWVEVSATWENSVNLRTDPYATTGNSWRFSPSDTGTGWIRVTLNNDGVTKPDTVPVHFTPGPPVRASFEIITPAAEIIAGKPILAVVRVYDKDGSSYSYKFDTTGGGRAAYHDTLGSGGLMFPEPFIVADGDSILLDQSPWGSGNQTFINGRDTVHFILYYAPLDTTRRHQIYVNLSMGSDTIRAATIPFVLHLDNVSQVRIEYPNGTPVSDTVYLTSLIVIVSRAFDSYGNKIGDIACNWTVTDSLHPITGQANGSTIFYDPSAVVRNERGFIIVDHNGIRDSMYVIIDGPPIRLVRAITRDTSGNGILDRVELCFSRKFELPANASFSGLTIVAYQRDTLTIGRMVNTGSGKNDSVWIVELVESHTDMPQTVWTPKIILPIQSAYDIAATTITAIDGAGPVVWRVVSYPVAASDHPFDTVAVTFSEPVQRWDGGSLNPTDRPIDIFYVWKRDTAGFILIDSMFAGINNLKRDPGRSNMLTFTMSNGNDLNRYYYLSIADSAREYLTDTTVYAVPPDLNNNPTRVLRAPLQNVLPGQFEFLSFGCKGSSRSLRYSLPGKCHVSLRYYDISGRMVASLINQEQQPGYYSLRLPFSVWARGTYIQVFTAGSFIKKDLIVVVR